MSTIVYQIITDNSNVFGELNTNAKLFVAELVGEPIAVLVGIIKNMDSSTSCDQRGDFQTSCNDIDCPRCLAVQMATSSLKVILDSKKNT